MKQNTAFSSELKELASTVNRLEVILAFSSGLAVLFWMVRFGITGKLTFIFLNWNLFLAWIPYVCIRCWSELQTVKGYAPLKVFLILVCLFFLPNAPYIITDFIHLKWNQDPFIWFDALLIFSFAWNGLMLFLATFNEIHRQLKPRLSPLWNHALMFLLAVLCGYGIYLGRFIRLNSWDVIRSPLTLVELTLERLFNPLSHPRTVGVTLFFALFLWLSFLCMQALSRNQQPINK